MSLCYPEGYDQPIEGDDERARGGPVPAIRTAVKTNVSEMEIEACDEGSLTFAEPLIRVSAANRNHS